MKKLPYLIVLALMLSGCSYKNDSIPLESYKANYNGEKTKKNISVFLSKVKDTRVDKRTIGYVLKDSKKTIALYSDDNFEQKYKEGLGYALNIAGFRTDVSKDIASMELEIFIEDIKIIYSGESFDKNLKGEISVKAILKQNNKVVTYNFKQKSAEWITPSHKSKDIAPFLHMIFADSINDIVAKLTTLK